MERRAVLHIDMDCFYAQVEHNRLGISRDEPLAVVQWEGLIAVNYAARAAGITRHDRATTALQKCPQIRLREPIANFAAVMQGIRGGRVVSATRNTAARCSSRCRCASPVPCSAPSPAAALPPCRSP